MYSSRRARARLRTTYDMIDRQMARNTWAMGDTFSLADCSAFPALFYANKVEPFGAAHRNVSAYLDRLNARPSITRVVKEAVGADGEAACFVLATLVSNGENNAL